MLHLKMQNRNRTNPTITEPSTGNHDMIFNSIKKSRHRISIEDRASLESKLEERKENEKIHCQNSN